jgi:D-beta-D-heptose 7-phosphate kinase / D-beta-D-heptose 1-phosphate adenosyltransferase
MNKRIYVIGDVMLDKYWNGESTRLSPESPVPVVDDIKVINRLGGAGNVCQNLRVFTDDVMLFSVIGRDREGAEIAQELANSDIINDLTLGENSKTITKTRVISNDQQLCRIDSGSLNDAPPRLGDTPDAIIVSDYGKGTITPEVIRDIIDNHDCNIFVDPKGNDWEKYAGVFCVTPNLKEFEEAHGPFSFEKARDVLEEYNLQGILVTLGANGMQWIGRDGKSIIRPGIAQEVRDVTGAGDTVIATFALFSDIDIKTAMDYANRAAGNVVAKLGTAVPDKEAVVETVVFTNGCFDLIHSGHIHLLQKASYMGDRLIVGINSDASMKRIKREPVNDQYERKEILESIAGVDHVIIFDDDTPYELIKSLQPDIIVKGGDYIKGNVVGADLAEVRIISILEGKSTSKTIERAKNVL